jgi:hypothetical protein
MHGCVSKPDDIVITSADYSNFEKSKLKALGGIVQSSLMTSHFLFVGYSMTDKNYLRIVDEVGRALASEDSTTESVDRDDEGADEAVDAIVEEMPGPGKPSDAGDTFSRGMIECACQSAALATLLAVLVSNQLRTK